MDRGDASSALKEDVGLRETPQLVTHSKAAAMTFQKLGKYVVEVDSTHYAVVNTRYDAMTMSRVLRDKCVIYEPK